MRKRQAAPSHDRGQSAPERQGPDRHGHPQAVNDHDNVVARERYLIVRNVMAEVLTERQHLIYVLRHVKELNSPEIGAALDISAVLARKELSAAQKALDRKEVKQRLRSLLHEER